MSPPPLNPVIRPAHVFVRPPLFQTRINISPLSLASTVLPFDLAPGVSNDTSDACWMIGRK